MLEAKLLLLPCQELACFPTMEERKIMLPATFKRDTVDGQNPAPPRMLIIPLFIGF